MHCIRINIFPRPTYREVGWDAEGKLERDFRQVGRQLLEVDALRAAACERCLKHSCERWDDRRFCSKVVI
jgi:hypothetical protein